MRLLPISSLAIALVLTGAQAGAQSPAIKDMRAPDAVQIAAMCPGIGSTGLIPGLTRSQQDPAALRALAENPAAPLPLEEATPDFTPWSDRLAAISWSGNGFEGMELLTWREELAATLGKYGWRLVSAPEQGDYPAYGGGPPQVWRRNFSTGDGPREMEVEFDTPGGFMLRCGPADLIELMRQESDGELADGSPRPVPPTPQELAGSREILARIDCTDPALIARFADADALDEVGPVVENAVGETLDLDAGARYQSRLRTWLSWRLRRSGQVSDEELWAAQDSVGHGDGGAMMDDATVMLSAMGRIAEAHARRDGAAICTGMRDMLQGAISRAAREAQMDAAANAAMEQLARQRGLDVS